MLRLLLITEDDPLYVARFFEVFFREYPRTEFEVLGVTIDQAFHEPLTRTAGRVLRFYGARDFVRLCSRFALRKVTGQSIAKLTRDQGIPLIPTASVNAPEYVERVRTAGPDVILSVAAPEIFRKPVLESAALGCINLHSGRLPRYRGMMPTFWQMLHGERVATITVHQMGERIDDGAILGTSDVPIRTRDSLDRLMLAGKEEGARLVIRVLRELAAGRASPRLPEANGASYFSFPKPADVREFRKRGHRLL